MTVHRIGAAAAAIALLGIAGCERVGNPFEVLAVKRPAPDEFQVIERRPLQMPASVTLPEPRPGARSPLEPDPSRDAAVALLGTPVRPVASVASAGEQALLSAADAAAANPEIRAALEADRADGSNQPYEPPTIWELFGGGSSEIPPEDALDAAAEARRLQAEGVAAAPVDPNARPEDEGEAEAAPPLVNTRDRRPVNKLPSSNPVPAF